MVPRFIVTKALLLVTIFLHCAESLVDKIVCNGSMLVNDLEKKVEELFRDGAKLPVRVSREKGNIEVRTKWEGDNMITFAEAKHVKHHPSEFKDFFVHFMDAFPKVNPMARKQVRLEVDNDREAVKCFLKFPFPLTDRVMIHWKYTKLDRSPDEHLLIISEEDNKEILAKHLSEEEKTKYVLARTFLCAYIVKPIRKNGEVIGSSVQYAFSGDTGGSIPPWIQNAVGPKTALDSVRGLLHFVGKKNIA